jgi:hypothetical protein
VKPWFRYTRLGGWFFVCWPCHWKGGLLLIGGLVAYFGTFIVLIQFAGPMHHPGWAWFAGVGALLAIYLVGVRHAEKL